MSLLKEKDYELLYRPSMKILKIYFFSNKYTTKNQTIIHIKPIPKL